MMVRHLVAVVLLAMTGCASTDDIRQAPVAWTAIYRVSYDTMANCIAALDEAAGIFRVTPQIYPREQRAKVLLALQTMVGPLLYGEYEIVTEGDTIIVSYRPIRMRNSGPVRTRETADRCGRT